MKPSLWNSRIRMPVFSVVITAAPQSGRKIRSVGLDSRVTNPEAS